MADNTFHTFPETVTEALAMLYVQNQDLSGVTPEGLLDMYQDAYKRIKAYRQEKRNTNQQQPIPVVPL
jgi:hypothetical protein